MQRLTTILAALLVAGVAFGQSFPLPGGSDLTVQDEGSNLTQRSTLNFAGAGVTCVDDAGNTRTDCTIPGGGGGSGGDPAVLLTADSGNDAADTALTTTYTIVSLSLAEVVDSGSAFTVNANEVCYDGGADIDVNLVAAFSFNRTLGSGTDQVDLTFGKDSTGAIGNGDEFGDVQSRTITSNTFGMGSLQASTTLTTNDCVGVLAKTDSANSVIPAGFSLSLSSPGTAAQSPWGNDIDAAGFSIVHDIDLTLGNPSTLTGDAPVAYTSIPTGPARVCSVADAGLDQNACNDDGDCSSGTCVATTIDKVRLRGPEFTAGGVNTTPTSWLAVDPIYNFFDYNGNDAGYTRDNDYAIVDMQLEFDYRPAGTTNERLMEWILQVAPVRSAAAGFDTEIYTRPWFQTVNHYPNHVTGEASMTNFSGFGNDLAMNISPATGNTQAFTAFLMGSAQTFRPNIVVQTAANATAGAGTGVSSLLSDQLGGITPKQDAFGDYSASSAMSVASEMITTHSNDYSGRVSHAVNYQTLGINDLGSCDGGGTAALGTPCSTNHACNSGFEYDAIDHPGICVHGNGVASNGTNDGVCVQNKASHSCQSVTAWVAGGCRGTTTISSLCDNLGSACDTTGTCIDHQKFWVPARAETNVSYNEIIFDQVDETTIVNQDTNIWGWCSGATNAWEEGVACLDNDDCTDTCVKQFDEPQHTNKMIGYNLKLLLNNDREEADVNAVSPFGAFGSERNAPSSFYGQSFELTWGASVDPPVTGAWTNYESPIIGASPTGTWFNMHIINIENQWASTFYRPVLFSVEAQTAATGANYGMEWATWGFNTGNWKLGDVRLWSEDGADGSGTSDVIRAEFNSNPGSATAGGVVMIATPHTSDPCSGKPESYTFYNDTSDYFCFCNGAGDDVQMHAPPTACY